ncbi:MAG TPA: adenylyl-sulfate kinase [Methylomirabilota bacterium]|nr:adenylyl-sulfate kinase [Methylomirabilota bacterium]
MTKVFWLFGRSGVGKTTLGRRLHQALMNRKVPVFYLDGDDMRSGLCSDLSFTHEARMENHRRIAEVAKLAAGQNLNVVVCTMAPEHSQRDVVAQVLGKRLAWIYVHAPLEVCIQRDPKGLYHRAQAGQLDKLLNFPFDTPRPHERKYFIDTVAQNIENASQSILELVQVCLSDAAI